MDTFTEVMLALFEALCWAAFFIMLFGFAAAITDFITTLNKAEEIENDELKDKGVK